MRGPLLWLGALLLASALGVGCKEHRPELPADFAMERSQALKAQAVYYEKECANCHILGGMGGKMGPSLQGIGGRHDPAWIKAYIANPQGVFQRSSMPRIPMSSEELELITAFLVAYR